MILNDFVKEYEIVESHLSSAKGFYNNALDIVQYYTNEFSKISAAYYTSSSNSPKEQLAGNLNKLFTGLYGQIVKLNSSSRDLYKCIGKLSALSFINKSLNSEVSSLISFADASIDSLYKIIENQLDASKKMSLFSPLIINLYSFIRHYDAILTLNKHFSSCKELLYEPLPTHIKDDKDYSEFVINSLVASDSFESLSSSISSFGEIYAGVSRLLELPTSDRCYIRKVETGSLVIVITGTTVSLFALGIFIDFCVKKYIEYRKAGLEIKSMRQQIATTDLAMAEKVLELNPNLENKAELLAKASESAFKYFRINPKFKIGDTLYDTGETTPLITDSSSTTTYSNNEND